MSPTRLFVCMTCGHRFEVSRVVADSSVSMTLCPRCGGNEIETIGEGTRESAPRPVPAADRQAPTEAPPERPAAEAPTHQAAPEQAPPEQPAPDQTAADEDAA